MIRKIEWFILAILSLIVVTFTLNWALEDAIHSQKDVLVPDLTGKPIMEVLNILSEQNLGLKKEGAEFNDTVPAGTVLRQQPEAGISVREGKVIRVTISQGGESVYVPELVGRSLRSSEIALRSYFLLLGEVRSQPSVKFEKDVVIAQEPLPNSIVLKNSLVHLTVSNGPPTDGTLLMPDFVGKSWEQVQSWAKEIKVKVEMTEEESASSPGTVLQQTAVPDSAIRSGDKIQFKVASGEQQAPMTVNVSERKFHYEAPQSESNKNYIFVLVDSSGSRELWRGQTAPGSKLDIPLPKKIGSSARIRIFVNGILTEERSIQ